MSTVVHRTLQRFNRPPRPRIRLPLGARVYREAEALLTGLGRGKPPAMARARTCLRAAWGFRCARSID